MNPNNLRILRMSAIVWAVYVSTFATASEAQTTVQVLHDHLPWDVASGQAQRVGFLSPSQRLQLAVMLPIHNQSALTSFLNQLYDPLSTGYRQYLSVNEFTARFGPAAADYRAVIDFADSHGLTVTDTAANHLVLDVEGSVEQIENALHVHMATYRLPPDNRTFYSPDREPSMALSTPVWHIEGLDNFLLARNHRQSRALTPEEESHLTGSGPKGNYLGSDMRAVYYGGTALTGKGQIVGLFEYYGYESSDILNYFKVAGQTNAVPIHAVTMNGVSASCSPPHCDDSEQVLDIVQAISMAPGLSQLRVYIGSRDADILNKMATENVAKQLSCSWGTAVQPSVDDPIFQEFAAQGQSFVDGSADSGAYTGHNNRDDGVYPADDAYVTAVGATDLTTAGPQGAWVSETAWIYSGGGPSDNGIALPAWQAGVANEANGGSTTLRNVPDVAMEGNTDNFACGNGTCYGGDGGTSYSAPRWAGFLALVNQQAAARSQSPVGFINPVIYAIGASPGYNADFHDITVGNNLCCGQQKGYAAVAGYDLVTGWEVPRDKV